MVDHKENSKLHWPYTKRIDGKIALTLDNNVWNFRLYTALTLIKEAAGRQRAIPLARPGLHLCRCPCVFSARDVSPSILFFPISTLRQMACNIADTTAPIVP